MPSIHVLIILVGLLLGNDLAAARDGGDAGNGWQFLVVIGWSLLVACVALVALPSCARAAAYRGSWKLLRRGLGLGEKLRWLVVLPFAIWSVTANGLGAVESLIGSWVALDEIAAVAPPLLALLAITWAEHPLHDRMRQAMLVRALDAGGIADRPPTRWEATVSRARAMLAMPLVPVLLIVTWHEAIAALLAGEPELVWRSIDIAGTIVIVAFAPAIIVRVLGTRSLESGEVRQRIDWLCKHMGARITGVRLWSHPSANAAILGLLPWARYMLVTEPLLRGMPRDELDAVVAHELAHVRQHHVLWIVLAMLALVTALGLVEPVLTWIMQAGGLGRGVSELVSLLLVASTAVLGFGFISRLIERHADARAAVALGSAIADDANADQTAVPQSGPDSMAAALDRVCALNGVDPKRWGFRHGSVRQRQRALARLAGIEARRLPVDRRVRVLRLATLLTLAIAGSVTLIGLSQGWFSV